MGTGRYRLTRDDLEAMRKEFGIGRFDESAQYLDDDLHQIRRNARLGSPQGSSFMPLTM